MPTLLFVCHANIARSAAAEFVAGHRLGTLSSWRVASAGVRALVGEDMDDTISTAVRDKGIPTRRHVARQVDASMLAEADLILAFEELHRDWMLRESPRAFTKIFTVRGAASVLRDIPRRAKPLEYLAQARVPATEDFDFADPYGRGKDVADRAIQEIDELLATILPGIDAVRRPPRVWPSTGADLA